MLLPPSLRLALMIQQLIFLPVILLHLFSVCSCLFVCFFLSACVAVEPETSEEEGTIRPISLDPDTRTLLESRITVCSVSIMPLVL